MGLYCRMTGDLEIRFNGKRLDFINKSNSKLSMLLVLLMFYHGQGVSRACLTENLYDINEDVDSTNSLKALLFRLRKAMADSGIKSKEYVVYQNGLYSLADDIEFDSDILRFRKYVEKGDSLNINDAYEYYKEAIDIIGGKLLPMFASEVWVLIERTSLENTYSRVLRNLCSYYVQNGKYSRAKEMYFRGKAMFPYEDEWEIGYLDCLAHEGRFSDAVEEYERYRRLLFDNMNEYPSSILQQCYHKMLNKQVFDSMSADDVASEFELNKPLGVYRCSFEKFADNYYLLKRIMMKENINSTLLLCGIVDEDKRLISDYGTVIKQTGYVENAMINCLRKSDIITRYGVAQMLILLWATPKENAPIVIDRINTAYNLLNTDSRYHIEYIVLDDEKIGLPKSDDRV